MRFFQNGEPEVEEAVWTGPVVEEERAAIELDPAIYDTYAGVYEVQPGFNLTVTREGDRLMTQATGQGQVEVFPESRTRFFLRVIDAQLTFVWSEDGEVNELILEQSGQKIRAKRIE